MVYNKKDFEFFFESYGMCTGIGGGCNLEGVVIDMLQALEYYKKRPTTEVPMDITTAWEALYDQLRKKQEVHDVLLGPKDFITKQMSLSYIELYIHSFSTISQELMTVLFASIEEVPLFISTGGMVEHIAKWRLQNGL